MADDRSATIYRMVLPDHECPFGKRAMQLLENAGYDVDEHLLTTREAVEAYKKQEQVSTTPQIFIDGERVGGSNDLEEYLANASA